MQNPESHIAKAIDHYLSVLEQQGRWWGWKNQTGKGMFMPHRTWWAAETLGDGRKAIPPYKAHAFDTGRVGSPDRVGIFRDDDGIGKFVAIEVKTSTGIQSAEQQYAEKIITHLGGVYVLARSVKDVEAKLVKRNASAGNDGYDYADIPF